MGKAPPQGWEECRMGKRQARKGTTRAGARERKRKGRTQFDGQCCHFGEAREGKGKGTEKERARQRRERTLSTLVPQEGRSTRRSEKGEGMGQGQPPNAQCGAIDLSGGPRLGQSGRDPQATGLVRQPQHGHCPNGWRAPQKALSSVPHVLSGCSSEDLGRQRLDWIFVRPQVFGGRRVEQCSKGAFRRYWGVQCIEGVLLGESGHECQWGCGCAMRMLLRTGTRKLKHLNRKQCWV